MNLGLIIHRYVENRKKVLVFSIFSQQCHPTAPIKTGPNHGYIDRFDNEWTKGPSRTPGQAFEWDVQLPKNGGNEQFRSLSPDGVHVNVTLDGRISH